ncbi:alpha/beta fold hydrolase [Pyxidicoccus sp. MSG2]|nr:alpha/beta fold hydrolase [Pyxidicoccus sp. MSG2]MCY1019238.1 alpha/beta fold hydrolase [Pyxidicoccus sp. MSG2]
MTAPERFEVVQGQTRLAGEHAGRGPALVFLHAGVADRRMWRAELAAFAPTHHALAYDRRGFGESHGVAESFSHVDDLRAVLDALGEGRRCWWVAHRADAWRSTSRWRIRSGCGGSCSSRPR